MDTGVTKKMKLKLRKTTTIDLVVKTFCCNDMKDNWNGAVSLQEDNPQKVCIRGIMVYQPIKYCPFCGKKIEVI